MTWLIIDKEIDPASERFLKAEAQATRIVNFGRARIDSPKLYDYSQEYNELRKGIRDKYLKYIAELGEIRINDKSLKETFLLEKGCSLWWFSEMIIKNSFNDSFFDDICKIIAIKRLLPKNREEKILTFSDSCLLNTWAGGAAPKLWKTIIRNMLHRMIYLVNTARNKYRLLVSGAKDPGQIGAGAALFLSFYPMNWTFDKAGNLSDRFFRELPARLKDPGYIINFHSGDTKGKMAPSEMKNTYFMQNNIGWLELFYRSLNLSNFIKYLLRRNEIKERSIFEGVDLSPVFEGFWLKTVIYNDLSYWVEMKSAERIIQKARPRQIVSIDEFGAYSRAVIVGAQKGKVPLTWLQHAVFSDWKLWLFNMPEEIVDAAGKINQDFIKHMPVADRWLVWGEQAIKKLPETGYPPGRMKVTGNPRYDIYRDNRKETKNEGPRRLILTPTVDRREIGYFIGLADELAQAFKGSEIIIKFHPRYQDVLDEATRLELERLKLKGIQIKTDSIENYYHSSNIVICGISTIAIEAAYFGLKVITMLSRYHDRFTPDWAEISSSAYSSKDLIDKIINLSQVKTLDWSQYYEKPGTALDATLRALND
jgi:hypothetical protein